MTMLIFVWRDWTKTTKDPSQSSRSSDQTFNPGPPNYEAGMLPIGEDFFSSDGVIINGELERLC
jgi:hypothetical protein